MKNQYVCDIGDFGKYLLLNHIAKPSSKDEILSLGINWYLTEDDNGNHGSYTEYLDPESDKNNARDSFCPLSYIVYNRLKRIYDEFGGKRTVGSIKDEKVLPSGTIFFSEQVDNKKRSDWIKKSIEKLSEKQIIFLDPDNGIVFNQKNKDLTKYVLLDDIKEYIEKTKSNIIIYNHGSRRKGGLENFSKNIIYPNLHNICHKSQIRILWYHRGTARLYIFVIRQKDKSLIDSRIKTLLLSCEDKRGKLFTGINL